MTTRRAHREAGFTLIELLIASSAGLILMFVVTGTVMDAMRMATLLNARLTLNREARVLIGILTHGGVQSGINTAPASQNYAFGLHGRRSTDATGTGWAPPADLMAKNGGGTRLYRLALAPDDSAPDPVPTGTLLGPRISSFEIDCAGADDPVQGCASSTSVTLFGRLRSDPTPVTNGRQREVPLRLFDPYVVDNRFATLEDASITFWTSFLLLVDEHPT